MESSNSGSATAVVAADEAVRADLKVRRYDGPLRRPILKSPNPEICQILNS
jgi:hypothetical protein